MATAQLCTFVSWLNCTFKLVDVIACELYFHKPDLFQSETLAPCLSSLPGSTCSVAGLSQDPIPGGERKGEHQAKGNTAVTAPGSSPVVASCPTSQRPTPVRICVSRTVRGSHKPVPHSSCQGPSRRHGPAVGYPVLMATLRVLHVPTQEGTISHSTGSGKWRDKPSSARDRRRPSPQEALPNDNCGDIHSCTGRR